MKILLATGIYPPESGGPATYTAGLASALMSRGHAVTVLAYGTSDASSAWPVHRVSRGGGPVVRYLRYAWHAFLLARKADVVYVQGPVSEGLPATIGARLAGRDVFMKVVGDYAWEMATQKQGRARQALPLLDEFLKGRHSGVVRFYEWAERWTSRKARRVIVPSRYLKTVVERWGVPSDRIEVVKNAVDPLPTTSGRDAERQALGVEGKTVVLTAVRAVPWKGVAEFVTWWKDIPASHLLVVAGDGPELERWKKLAVSEGVAERVRFLGRIDRQTMAQWYTAADAFALNSGYEGYPHVVAEAASIGLPCLVSDQGGNPETVEDFGSLVTVVPYGDKGRWVEALSRIETRKTGGVPVFTGTTGGWSYDYMVGVTERYLKGEEGRMRVVMIGYERKLLDATSSESIRVGSLATDGTSIRSVVISRCPSDAVVGDGTFRAMGFRGMSLRRIWRAIRAGIREAGVLRGATVVSAQDPFAAGFVGYVISRWTNVPLEIQEHGDFFSGFWAKESWKNRVWSWFGRFILHRAERVRAVSERVKEHLIRIGVPSERIDIIPVSMDLSVIPAQAGIPPLGGNVRIVAPCRFVRQKGLDVLLDAARLLKTRGRRFILMLTGDGPERLWLEEKVRALHLDDVVRIESWRDASTLWDDADLFVLSSLYEGWGRTIVEAMAAGVPVVATDVGCVGSFLRKDIDGLVVRPNDAQALAEAVDRQIADPERRLRMAASARERAATFPSRDALHRRQREGWRGMPQRPAVGPRFDLWILAFLVFVILSRAASVALFHGSLLNREWGFMTMIEYFFRGDGFAMAPCHLTAMRSPGYLFFLTALYTVFSPANTIAQAIAQNVFVVGILWLVYAVGARLVGKRAALVAGFLMAAYPYTFYHYTQYYHTFLSSFFLLLIVWMVLRFAESKRWRFAIGSGLSIACLALTQGTILPATPFIAAWVLWRLWPDWRRAIAGVALMALFSAGLIAPWTIRNWVALHAFVPISTELGFGLYKANNENIYELTRRGYPQEVVDDEVTSSTDPRYLIYRLRPEIEAELAADGVLRDSAFWTEWHPRAPLRVEDACNDLTTFNEARENAYWSGKATAWLKGNWFSDGWKLQLLKLKTFWQPSLFPSVKTGAPWSFGSDPVKVWLARSAVTAASAVVIFGGWIGVFLLLRRRNREAVLLLAIVLVYTFMHTLFAGYTKYRIPLDNLMAIFAGAALVALWDFIRGRRGPKS
ncbi:MAG: glycosyltransferase [Patescibacteria group bacterium]